MHAPHVKSLTRGIRSRPGRVPACPARGARVVFCDHAHSGSRRELHVRQCECRGSPCHSSSWRPPGHRGRPSPVRGRRERTRNSKVRYKAPTPRRAHWPRPPGLRLLTSRRFRPRDPASRHAPPAALLRVNRWRWEGSPRSEQRRRSPGRSREPRRPAGVRPRHDSLHSRPGHSRRPHDATLARRRPHSPHRSRGLAGLRRCEVPPGSRRGRTRPFEHGALVAIRGAGPKADDRCARQENHRTCRRTSRRTGRTGRHFVSLHGVSLHARSGRKCGRNCRPGEPRCPAPELPAGAT